MRRQRTFIGLAVGVAVATVAVLIAAGAFRSPHRHAAPTRTLSHHPRARPAVHLPVVLFGPNSIWNQALPPDAPVDPTSPQLVQALNHDVGSELRERTGPWIASTVASTPLYVVSADQPRLHVQLDGPAVPGRAALQSAFDAVPIPPGARPAAGLDAHMTVWQPSTDTLWEFFEARRVGDRWYANWGGAIHNVSRSPGYYTPNAWPGATLNWGATATSLPVVGGVILLQELGARTIDHAMAIDLPAPRAGVFAWPAQRTDGTGGPDTLPEGARLRLDPSLDLNRLSVPPLTRIIAEAAQRYGMIVRDQTRQGISLFVQDPTPLHRDPLNGPSGAYGGLLPSQLLAQFPWSRLQVLKLHLCSSAPCQP